MFGKKWSLFSLFGFKVSVDASWIFLAVLITWSLAKGLFPYYFEGFSNATYWWMGIGGALGLFGSIIFHEFCHSLVAKQYGIPMKGITLFIFGGVAEMSEEPKNPKIEFLMAAAGPASSIVLGGFLFLLHAVGTAWYEPARGVIIYLAWLNIFLAIFNLIPAFPLDGGRILRSILWAIKKNLRWATKIASGFGSAFGIFLIVIGIISFIAGNFIEGLWYLLIGMFIRGASVTSYKQLIIQNALAGEQVKRFMKTNPVTVPPWVSVRELIDDFFYKYHFRMFPVVEGDRLMGCITTDQIKELPKDQWNNHKVSDLAIPCSEENTVSPETDAVKTLSLMNKTKNTRLMVVDNGHLAGVVSLKDLLKFLAIKMDLEEGEQIEIAPQ